MTQKQSQIRTWSNLVGMAVILATAIVSIMAIKADAAAALKDVARLESRLEKTEAVAEQNARDFAFFKGEVNAKLDNIIASARRQEQFIQNLELADAKTQSP